jgi:mRNA interferase MazF
MKRGDLISVSLAGDYGKPRPAVVIQSDDFEHLQSVTVLPLTSNVLSMEACRVPLEPSEQNGLRRTSQVMIEKTGSLPRSNAGPVIGRLSADDMARVERAVAVFLGFA